MAINQFESSRVAAGTLTPGAQKLTDTSHDVPVESNTPSRDDVRDGVAEPEGRRANVIAATDLTGDHVYNPAGESLGKIHQIMLDTTTGKIAYAVVSSGGFLKMGEKLLAVPWNALQFDPERKEFILSIDRHMLENAPRLDQGQWPDMEAPHWRQDFTDAGDYIGDNSQPNRSMEYEPVSSFHRAKR
jgi:sporulation protein YlmC with PRC-barrel domain